jgi:hypothetical protein
MARIRLEAGAVRREALVSAMTKALARPVAKVAAPGDSWRSLVRLFTYLKFADTDDIWAGAEASFGWMPSILNAVHEIDEIHRIVLDVRKQIGRYVPGTGGFDPPLGAKFIKIIEGVENASEVLTSLEITAGQGDRHHSAVGTSKFLHFLAPHVAPIYDSWVGACIGGFVGKKTLHEELKRADGYIDYVSAVHEIAARVVGGDVKIPRRITEALVKSNLGRDVPLVRQIEFALYSVRPPS